MCFNFYRHKFIFFVKAYSLKIYSWIWWSGLELKTCWKQRHVHTTFRKKVCPVGSLQDLLLHIIVLNVKIFVSYWFLLIFFFFVSPSGRHWTLMQIFHSYNCIFFFSLLGRPKFSREVVTRNLSFNTFYFCTVPFFLLIIQFFIFCPCYLELDRILIKSCHFLLKSVEPQMVISHI